MSPTQLQFRRSALGAAADARRGRLRTSRRVLPPRAHGRLVALAKHIERMQQDCFLSMDAGSCTQSGRSIKRGHSSGCFLLRMCAAAAAAEYARAPLLCRTTRRAAPCLYAKAQAYGCLVRNPHHWLGSSRELRKPCLNQSTSDLVAWWIARFWGSRNSRSPQSPVDVNMLLRLSCSTCCECRAGWKNVSQAAASVAQTRRSRAHEAQRASWTPGCLAPSPLSPGATSLPCPTHSRGDARGLS